MPDELIPVFMPSLAAMLTRAEELKQSPLTQTEVERIRDAAVCIMMPQDAARQMAESRGYTDINPENCWAEWQTMRAKSA